MKAAIFNPYWDTLGGGERYVASFVRLLLNKHWQVDIWWPQNISSAINSRFNIDISTANFVSRQSSSQYDLLFWVSDGSLPSSLAKKTFVHFQFPFQNISGHSLPNYFKSRFYKFIVNSEFTQKVIDKEFSVNSTVIYPPIDVDKFIPGTKDRTILYVGRFSNLTQSKGQEILISVFKKFHKRIPGWKLILAGGASVGVSVETLSALKKSARGFPIQIVTDPDFAVLKKLYASATLFWSGSGFGEDETISPLKVEHFGISVVEAMAAGCVPLIVNLGGHREIVNSGRDGFLWNSPDELGELTQKLINHPKLMSDISQAAIAKSKIFGIAQFNAAFSKILHI